MHVTLHVGIIQVIYQNIVIQVIIQYPPFFAYCTHTFIQIINDFDPCAVGAHSLFERAPSKILTQWRCIDTRE